MQLSAAANTLRNNPQVHIELRGCAKTPAEIKRVKERIKTMKLHFVDKEGIEEKRIRSGKIFYTSSKIDVIEISFRED